LTVAEQYGSCPRECVPAHCEKSVVVSGVHLQVVICFSLRSGFLLYSRQHQRLGVCNCCSPMTVLLELQGASTSALNYFPYVWERQACVQLFCLFRHWSISRYLFDHCCLLLDVLGTSVRSYNTSKVETMSMRFYTCTQDRRLVIFYRAISSP
jgi:hypothetical protein